MPAYKKRYPSAVSIPDAACRRHWGALFLVSGYSSDSSFALLHRVEVYHSCSLQYISVAFGNERVSYWWKLWSLPFCLISPLPLFAVLLSNQVCQLKTHGQRSLVKILIGSSRLWNNSQFVRTGNNSIANWFQLEQTANYSIDQLNQLEILTRIPSKVRTEWRKCPRELMITNMK